MTIRNNTELIVEEEDSFFRVRALDEERRDQPLPTRLRKKTVYDAVFECWHQDQKYARTEHWLKATQWLAILTEEVGEVATEVLNVEFQSDKLAAVQNLRAESVQVAAVALRIVDAIDRGQLLDEV